MILLLCLSLAWADPAADLRALDALLSTLKAPPPSGDSLALTEWVEASTQALLALKAQALAATEEADPAQRCRVHLRLGEGSLHLASTLADLACPAGLDATTCGHFSAAMAQQAARLLPLARQSLALAEAEAINAQAGPRPLGRKEGQRLATLLRDLGRTEARLPHPSAGPYPVPDAPDPLRGARPRAAALAAGPTPAARDEEARPDLTSDFVLVDKTAWLSARRDGSGSRVRAGPPLREDGVPEPMLARLLQLDGDRALLELGPGDPRYHCFYDPPWPSAWRIALWVDRSALLAVTQAPVERRFPDGSGVALRPGALVSEQGLWADGVRLPLDLEPAEVGLSYHESARFPSKPGREVLLAADTPLSLGGRPLGPPPGDWRGGPERAFQHLEVGPDGRQRVGLDSTCGQITLLAEGPPDDGDGDPEAASLWGDVVGGVVGPMTTLRAGTPLWWEEGGLAGLLTEDVYLDDTRFPLEADGRRCLDLALDGLEPGEADRPDRHLRLCVKPAP